MKQTTKTQIKQHKPSNPFLFNTKAIEKADLKNMVSVIDILEKNSEKPLFDYEGMSTESYHVAFKDYLQKHGNYALTRTEVNHYIKDTFKNMVQINIHTTYRYAMLDFIRDLKYQLQHSRIADDTRAITQIIQDVSKILFNSFTNNFCAYSATLCREIIESTMNIDSSNISAEDFLTWKLSKIDSASTFVVMQLSCIVMDTVAMYIATIPRFNEYQHICIDISQQLTPLFEETRTVFYDIILEQIYPQVKSYMMPE